MIERKRSGEHKVKPCDDLDGASRQDKVETWNLGKEKMSKRNQEFFNEPPERRN